MKHLLLAGQQAVITAFKVLKSVKSFWSRFRNNIFESPEIWHNVIAPCILRWAQPNDHLIVLFTSYNFPFFILKGSIAERNVHQWGKDWNEQEAHFGTPWYDFDHPSENASLLLSWLSPPWKWFAWATFKALSFGQKTWLRRMRHSVFGPWFSYVQNVRIEAHQKEQTDGL